MTMMVGRVPWRVLAATVLLVLLLSTTSADGADVADVGASDAAPRPLFVLTMIVKNEAAIIERLLRTVVGVVDYWVICDTGSSDATPAIIERFFAAHNIAGELHHDAWRDFAHNRNLAVERSLGKGDYLLLLDADMELVGDFDGWVDDFRAAAARNDTLDAYNVRIRGGVLDYTLRYCVRASLPWRYRGVTHEHIDVAWDALDDAAAERRRAVRAGECRWFHVVHHADGSTRPEKYERDIELLRAGLRDEPYNERYVYYLGQSLRDLGRHAEAVSVFERRAAMGGTHHEEVYMALLSRARSMRALGNDTATVLEALMRAHRYRPHRLEALHDFAKLCNDHMLHHLAWHTVRPYIDVPYPSGDILFVNEPIHRWKFADQASLAAHYAGLPAVAYRLTRRILDLGVAPPSEHARLRDNLRWNLRDMSEDARNLLALDPLAPPSNAVAAAATPSKDVDLDAKQLAAELSTIAEQAEAKKLEL